MKIYILGLDHGTQNRSSIWKTDPSYHMEFEKLVRELVAEHSVTFIGDETLPEQLPIAKEIGGSLAIDWDVIEMSHAARKELGIENEQRNRNEPIFKDHMVVGSVERRVLSDEIREAYMIWKAITKAEELNARSVLILCGHHHVQGLRSGFLREGHEVTTDSLCKYPWYAHPACE